LKIFEAMSAGRPVVSTRIGAEGLPVEHGRHLLLADTPDEFAAAVLTLFRDTSRRDAIAREARALVTERFDWAAAALQLEASIAETRMLDVTSDAASIPLTSVRP
jgi:glycosyltransferase involved in cell wall biosynthesis